MSKARSSSFGEENDGNARDKILTRARLKYTHLKDFKKSLFGIRYTCSRVRNEKDEHEGLTCSRGTNISFFSRKQELSYFRVKRNCPYSTLLPSRILKVACTSANVITHNYVVLSIFGLRSTNLEINSLMSGQCARFTTTRAVSTLLPIINRQPLSSQRNFVCLNAFLFLTNPRANTYKAPLIYFVWLGAQISCFVRRHVQYKYLFNT